MLHALAATISLALVSLAFLVIALELIRNGGRIRAALAGDLGLPLVEINQMMPMPASSATAPAHRVQSLRVTLPQAA